MGWRSKRWCKPEVDELNDLEQLFEKLWPHKMMLESSRYEKWERERERERGGGSGGGPPGPPASWGGSGGARDRDRERDRERERQMRAHQMSHPHAAEPDPSPSLFSAPIRIKQKDHVSQQIQNKLGDYNLAQPLLDDPSKSIGIYAEPPSPAPCISSRRDEFKKPSHAPQNGRVHRPYSYNKSEVAGSTGSSSHRPPPLRIPNGHQPQSAIDSSSQPPIESILKEMKALPTPLSVIAATPRKEADNKFIFNHYTNKVQENPELTTSNDLKHPLPKPGLDNRISNSRSSLSPVNKSLALSESDDEGPATTTVVHNKLEPFVSPLGRSSSGSDSSPSDSESESSSAESAPAAPPSAPAPPPARPSWSLSNFAPPPAQPSNHTPYDSAKELRHALADVKPSPPISEMSSDSESASPSPVPRRRRSTAKRTSTSSEDDSHAHVNTPSPRTSQPSSGQKRGRPPKPRPAEVPLKKKRGRPPKPKPAPEPEPEREPPPPAPLAGVQPAPALAHDTKSHIFRKVFTPKKGDEGGGKGGKGGKGKGGKGKGQVTIIEVTAPESGADDDDRIRDERRNEEAIARVSPPREPQPIARRRDSERNNERTNERIQDRTNDRIQDRVSIERVDHRRTDDRIPDRQLPERTSNDRLERHDRIPSDRIASDRRSDRLSTDRTPSERLERSSDRQERSERIDRKTERIERIERPSERTERSSERLERSSERLEHSSDRLERSSDKIERPSDRIERPSDRIERPSDRIDRSSERLDRSSDRLERSSDRLERSSDRLSDRLDRSSMSERSSTSDRSSDRLSERLSGDKASFEKSVHLSEKLVKQERLSSDKPDRVSSDKVKAEKTERFYVRAEADVGSGVKVPRERDRDRQRVVVRIPLRQLRADTVRALMNPPARTLIKAEPQPVDMEVEVAPTNHERAGESTPIYYSYFERLPADVLSDEERDHTYYLAEAKRIRASAERENEPVAKVMLYLESVLCFVLTGRVLELEHDTKRAFTVYRETIEYIKSIHSMPQRYRAEQHSTSAKLDILSLRVQSLLYLRMFKMYNREVKEYNKIVNEYQQKPAMAESVSPLSPTPSPAGSVGSATSASSGYCSLTHPVPSAAHNALLQLTKYYTFLYVAHELWEQADTLCRLRSNLDLFIAVDRKCGPLSLFTTFRHLVQYVRYAIQLLKAAPRE